MTKRWSHDADPRPFRDASTVAIVLPRSENPDTATSIVALTSLLRAGAFELEVELGAPPVFVDDVPIGSIAPRCLIGPSPFNPALKRELEALDIDRATRPFVWINRARNVVIIDGSDLADVTEAFQLLRTATRSGDVLTFGTAVSSPDAVIDLLRREVATTYPAFALRSIDWETVLDRHVAAIRHSNASLRSLQELFSELGDPHTWVMSSTTNARLPYRAWAVGDRLTPQPHPDVVVRLALWCAAW